MSDPVCHAPSSPHVQLELTLQLHVTFARRDRACPYTCRVRRVIRPLCAIGLTCADSTSDRCRPELAFI